MAVAFAAGGLCRARNAARARRGVCGAAARVRVSERTRARGRRSAATAAAAATVDDGSARTAGDARFEALRVKVQKYLEDVAAELGTGEAPSSDDLRYTTLQARGRADLVDDILSCGGHMAVARRLGLPDPNLTEEELLERRKELMEKRVRVAEFTPVKPTEGFLTLGSSKDQRVNTPYVDDGAREAARKALVGRARTSPPTFFLDSPQMRILRGDKVPDAEVVRGEQLSLTLLERLDMLAFFALVAAAFGPASRDVLSADTLRVMQAVATLATAGHLALALFGAATARGKNRSVAVWAVKCFLGGGVAANNLRAFAPIPPFFKPPRS